MSKDLPLKAERAAEHWLREDYGCVVTCRAVKTRFMRQDIFGGDVVGKDEKGRLYVAQVTTGGYSALSNRRRKLEAIPFREDDFVFLLQLKVNKKKRPYTYLFRIQELADGEWKDLGEREIPREWFKAYRRSGNGS